MKINKSQVTEMLSVDVDFSKVVKDYNASRSKSKKNLKKIISAIKKNGRVKVIKERQLHNQWDEKPRMLIDRLYVIMAGSKHNLEDILKEAAKSVGKKVIKSRTGNNFNVFVKTPSSKVKINCYFYVPESGSTYFDISVEITFNDKNTYNADSIRNITTQLRKDKKSGKIKPYNFK